MDQCARIAFPVGKQTMTRAIDYVFLSASPSFLLDYSLRELP